MTYSPATYDQLAAVYGESEGADDWLSISTGHLSAATRQHIRHHARPAQRACAHHEFINTLTGGSQAAPRHTFVDCVERDE